MADESDDDAAARTLLSTFGSTDFASLLCEALDCRGIVALESSCSALRCAIEPLWAVWLHATGFAEELEVPDAALPSAARRVVCLETERRATFPRRLRAALQRLGLHAIHPPRDDIGYLSHRDAGTATVCEGRLRAASEAKSTCQPA